MDTFGSIDPAALAVAIIAVLYGMKDTLSNWTEIMENSIGYLVMLQYANACGSRTILKFLDDVGNEDHSRYAFDGVTIKELKFANHIVKRCQIWKMAWWMDIVLTAGLGIQIFPQPIRWLLWTTIILISSPIAVIAKVWDKVTYETAKRNLGIDAAYNFLFTYMTEDYKFGTGRASEDNIRMFALRTIIALGFGDDLGALGLLKLCTPTTTYTRVDFLTHVAVAKKVDRYYKPGNETFSKIHIELEFDPVEIVAIDGFSRPAGGYTALALSMAAKWLATAKDIKPMIPYVSWELQAATQAHLSKDSQKEYKSKQLAWRTVDTCIIISRAVRVAMDKDCKSDTEGISELEKLLEGCFPGKLPFKRPSFGDMKGQFPWCSIDHSQSDCVCNCLALPYEAVSFQAVVGHNFSQRVPTLVISENEQKAYYDVIYGGKNAVRLREHNLRDFILGDFLEVFGVIVAGKSPNHTPSNGHVVTVQVQP
ncbi:hypothetical protein INT44_002482 [Umbelopsis vinacea]|uniref:Uncharacterized protein n=1 Tax=Umbelopsis vinacea TaxID=44442 RepID=A0A8H7Q611_9FUNG|nr:hypothetical protein INT44_002482 [Umbelopsis vinacea]